jgi:hypothetical protein
LANRFGADGIDQAEDDHLVAKQLQGPVAAAKRRVAASHADEFLLDVALDLDLVGPGRLAVAVDGSSKALGDETLANPGDGPLADAQGGADVVVRPPWAEGVVGQQEDAGVGQLAGRRLAGGHQALQVRSLVRLQRHPILVHRCTSLLDPRAQASSNRIANHLSNED